MKTSDVKKELRSLGIKTYKNKNDKFFVRKGDIKKVLASIVKSNADDEERKLEGSSKLMELLDELNISRSPAYTGWGLEVYIDKETKTQVVANFRNDTILIHRGY